MSVHANVVENSLPLLIYPANFVENMDGKGSRQLGLGLDRENSAFLILGAQRGKEASSFVNKLVHTYQVFSSIGLFCLHTSTILISVVLQ